MSEYLNKRLKEFDRVISSTKPIEESGNSILTNYRSTGGSSFESLAKRISQEKESEKLRNRMPVELSMTDLVKRTLTPEVISSAVSKRDSGNTVRRTDAREVFETKKEKGTAKKVLGKEEFKPIKTVANALLAGIINLARTTAYKATDTDEYNVAVTGMTKRDIEEKTRDEYSKNIENALERTKGTPLYGIVKLQEKLQGVAAKAMYGTETQKSISAKIDETTSKADDQMISFLKNQEKAAIQRSGIETGGTATRIIGGAAQSLPASMATRIPILGWAMMFNGSFQNTIEQELEMKKEWSREDVGNILIKATANAALEIGTEMIAPLFGKGFKTATKGIAKSAGKEVAEASLLNATKGLVNLIKSTSKELAEPTVKNVAIKILSSMIGEGVEEGINYIGSAYVSKITTDKDKVVWASKENPEAIASIAGMFEAMASGALMAGVTGVRHIPNAIRYNRYKNFTETIKEAEKIKDKPMDKVTTKNAEDLINAMDKDMENPENVRTIMDFMFESMETKKAKEEVAPLATDKKPIETTATSPISNAERQKVEQRLDSVNQRIELLKQEIATKQAEAKSKGNTADIVEQQNYIELSETERDILQKQLKATTPTTTPQTDVGTSEFTMPVEAPTTPSKPVDSKSKVVRLSGQTVSFSKPVETVAKDLESAPKGDTINSSYTLGKRVDTVATVLPATSVIPSMDADLNRYDVYDAELQPRNVERADSATLVNNIASKPVMEDLFRKETIGEGIPVVDQRGMVVAGNHRVAGILKMMRDYPANYEAYKQYARDHASELGLTPEQLQGDFIVTRVLPKGIDAKGIAYLTNVPTTRGMSPTEIAQNDSKRMTDKMLSDFVGREDGLIDTKDNRAFIQGFMSEVIAPSELNKYQNKDGNLNADGIKRIVNAIFHRAYGDTALLDRVAESTDNDIKRVTTSMVNVAPALVEIQEGIKKGNYYDIDLAPLIKDSAEEWVRMKESGDNVQMYATQVEMGDSAETIRTKNMLFAMDINKGSAKKLTELYTTMITAIKEAGSPNQVSLFGDITLTIDNVINTAKKVYGIENTVEVQEGVKQDEKRTAETAKQPEDRKLPAKKDTVKKETGRKVESQQEAVTSKIMKDDGEETDTITYKDGNIKIMLNSPYAPKNEHSVVNFFVPEKSRKQGIGTRLINEIKTKYGEKGISSQVSNLNSLRLFYNNGFRPRKNMDATLQEAISMFNENESLNMTYNNNMTKQEAVTPKTVAESKPKTAGQVIAEESQRQDTSNTEGFLPKYFQQETEPVAFNQKEGQSWEDTISPETKERLKKASTLSQEPITDRIKRYAKQFREFTTLGSVPIPVNMGDLRMQFRKSRTARSQAQMKATDIVRLTYNSVNKNQYDLLSKTILYFDMVENIQRGLWKSGQQIVFGIKSPEEALRTANAIAKEVQKPENALVLEAYKKRKKMLNAIRSDLLVESKKAGVDLDIITQRSDYMYHAVIAYQTEFSRHAKRNRGKKVLSYQARTGSIQDYISDPVFADYLITTKMVSDTYRLRLYNEVMKRDVSSKTPKDEDGNYIVEDGFEEVDVSILGIPHLDKYSKNKIIKDTVDMLESLGVERNSPEWDKAIRGAIAEGNKHTIIIEDSIVKALEYEFGKREKYIGRSMKFVMNAWKYSKLRLPNVVWRYNIRNLFGDLDAVVIGDPKTMFKVPKAAKELYDFYYKEGVLTENLSDFVEITGLVSGQVAQELKQLRSMPSMKFYAKSNTTSDVAKRGIKKAWSMLTLETATEYREQVLRYASYLSFLEQLQKNNGKVKSYAMSIPSEIDSITNIKDKAAKLANDMVGAYDDVSIVGQYAADHLMPFFRFKEINIKRYYRMMKNIFYTSPETMNSVGTGILGTLGKLGKAGALSTWKATKVAMSVLLYYGILDRLNRLFAPDEEEALPKDVKNRPHIVLPRWIDGKERIYYIDRLGSFAELLDIFGIDRSIGKDLSDVITGRMTLEQKMQEMLDTGELKDMAMSPINDIFNSSFPLAKMSVELLTGQELFPDPSTPRQMRDKWEYVFNQLGFKDEYKALAGKPIIEGSYGKQKRSIIFSSVAEGEAAYWEVYNMVDDFYMRHEIGQTYTQWQDKSSKEAKKAQAAYYYKLALKMEDPKAAEKYLKEYVFYGGTQKTFDATMRSMQPLYFMKEEDRTKFQSELSEEDKVIFEKAVNYFEELQKIKATSLPKN